MNLYISHMSALRYWRQFEGLATTKRSTSQSLRRSICSVKDMKAMKPKEYGFVYNTDHPLHVLVHDAASRLYAKELRPHVWTTNLPNHAFRLVAPGIYVSSPEFVFLQLASMLSLIELAQLGNELCGGYFLLATSGFQKRENKRPITTRKKLLAFVEQMSDARGAKKALRALKWVADHCNSPMETNTLLALCLPRRMGGWSLPLPQVNKSVKVGKRMKHYVNGSKYTPDYLWTRKIGGKTVYITGEYDSHECHDEEIDAEHTRIRRNDMKSMGYLVTSINKSQMNDANKLQYAARQIARDLGLYRSVPDGATLAKQNALLRQLKREAFR